MEHIAPLVQTILWVGLMGAIFWRYHIGIGKLIDAMHKRIEQGGGIEAGFLKLPEFRPQNPSQQKQRLELEVQQVQEAEQAQEETPDDMPAAPANAADSLDVRGRVLQAEDLALRAIQADYTTAIGRQLQIGSSIQVDAVFHLQNVLHVVEVKYVRRKYPRTLLLKTVERLLTLLRASVPSNFKLLVVLVYGHEYVNTAAERDRLNQALEVYKGQVELLCFTLPELARRFGVEVA
jgi:hypothetical protein